MKEFDKNNIIEIFQLIHSMIEGGFEFSIGHDDKVIPNWIGTLRHKNGEFYMYRDHSPIKMITGLARKVHMEHHGHSPLWSTDTRKL